MDRYEETLAALGRALALMEEEDNGLISSHLAASIALIEEARSQVRAVTPKQ